MSESAAFYSIVQYMAYPERLEAVNVGVVIFDREHGRLLQKIALDISRLRRLGRFEINKTFFDASVQDFVSRIELEYSKSMSIEKLFSFIDRRANNLRLTQPLPVIARDLRAELQYLHRDLVGEPKVIYRRDRVKTKLRRELEEAGIAHLLDKRPAPVAIERYNILLKPEYGYKNGHYNLVDASRFEIGEQGLAEAGKRSLEGRSLAEINDYRLIIIGEFPDDSSDFYNAIREDLQRSEVRLFRLDEIQEFAISVKQHI